MAQNWQKSYFDKRRHDLEFQVGDRLLEGLPTSGLKRFGVREKLNSPLYQTFRDFRADQSRGLPTHFTTEPLGSSQFFSHFNALKIRV